MGRSWLSQFTRWIGRLFSNLGTDVTLGADNADLLALLEAIRDRLTRGR